MEDLLQNPHSHQRINTIRTSRSNICNTRIHKGLTPTPIGIAGDNALLATIKPQDGPWLYFVTTNLKTGETKFADNKDDFLKFRDEYKRNNPEGN